MTRPHAITRMHATNRRLVARQNRTMPLSVTMRRPARSGWKSDMTPEIRPALAVEMLAAGLLKCTWSNTFDAVMLKVNRTSPARRVSFVKLT